ncbi:MAG: redoxin domain-containing protein [Deltaproteobacteria bacterium]|nr:redoxin domain-containing protein [Deltaproteobacteria bacterium]
MEESKEALRKNGLGVCAISYDSPEVLRKIAQEKNLTIPLLSDQGSRIIRAFHTMDTSVAPDNPAYGVPLHGSYVVNADGIVEMKLFEKNAGHSSGIVLTRLFGSPLNTHEKLVKLNYMTLRYYASANAITADDPLHLTIEVSLNDNVHMYAPQGGGEVSSLTWDMDMQEGVSSQPVEYPPPHGTTLPWVQEEIPIYQGTFRITRKVTIPLDIRKFANLLNTDGDLAITGTLRYQACDDQTCYLPQTVPLAWKVKINSLPILQ